MVRRGDFFPSIARKRCTVGGLWKGGILIPPKNQSKRLPFAGLVAESSAKSAADLAALGQSTSRVSDATKNGILPRVGGNLR
jgi:hypothetical protein